MLRSLIPLAVLSIALPALAADDATTEGTGLAAADDAGRQEGGIFYKGELGSPGAPRLESPNDSFFVGIGYYNIGGLLGQNYARVTPELNLFFDEKRLVLRLQAPINVMAYDGQHKVDRYTIRKADWNSFADYLKVFKQISYGRKEDHLFINVGITHGVSIGHGTVMRRYDANMDLDQTRLGVELDAYNDYGGFETFIADVAWQSQVVGGLVFVKPLAVFSDDVTARSLSFGAHYTADLAAPVQQRLTPGTQAGAWVHVLDKDGYAVYDTSPLDIVGVDAEIKPIHLGTWLDVKLYGDYSHIQDAGSGLTGGLLARMSFGPKNFVNAARIRLEERYYDNNYIPQYFDSLYEVEKYQMLRGPRPGYPKYATLMGYTDPSDPSRNLAKPASGPKHQSLYVEASYAIVDRLVLGAALEKLENGYNVLGQIEIPAFEILRLYGTYQKLGFASLGDFKPRWTGKGFEPGVVMTAQARLMLLPILFLDAIVRQSYERDLGVNYGDYRPKLDFLVQAELGWEFTK